MSVIESLQRRLKSIGCYASIDQICGYLDSSGQSISDLERMTDDQLQQWFSSCLDRVYALTK